MNVFTDLMSVFTSEPYRSLLYVMELFFLHNCALRLCTLTQAYSPTPPKKEKEREKEKNEKRC